MKTFLIALVVMFVVETNVAQAGFVPVPTSQCRDGLYTTLDQQEELEYAMRVMACAVLSLDENIDILHQEVSVHTMHDGFIVSATHVTGQWTMFVTIEEMVIDGEKSSFYFSLPLVKSPKEIRYWK